MTILKHQKIAELKNLILHNERKLGMRTLVNTIAHILDQMPADQAIGIVNQVKIDTMQIEEPAA